MPKANFEFSVILSGGGPYVPPPTVNRVNAYSDISTVFLGERKRDWTAWDVDNVVRVWDNWGVGKW